MDRDEAIRAMHPMSSGKADTHQTEAGYPAAIFTKTTLRMADGRGARLLLDTAIQSRAVIADIYTMSKIGRRSHPPARFQPVAG